MKIKKELYIAGLNAFVLVVLGLIGYGIGNACYTLNWSLHSGLYWIATLLTTCTFAFGKWRFSIATLLGSILGVVFGQLFGPNPNGAAWGFGHYGWLIWLCFFAIGIVSGISAELAVFYKKRKSAEKKADE